MTYGLRGQSSLGQSRFSTDFYSASSWKHSDLRSPSRRHSEEQHTQSWNRKQRAQPPSQSGNLGGSSSASHGTRWSAATIVENKAESLDGSLRTLVLSVEDKVTFLEGRSMHRKQERPRWVDTYQVPGQFVAIRAPQHGTEPHNGRPGAGQSLFPISSSPYAVRRDSADLDASIIEILVNRQGKQHDKSLAELGPGKLLDVSNVLGRGFSTMFDSHVGLSSALEDSRNISLIGFGCRGIAALRAVLEWTPVQAHATAHTVSLLYACPSATSAAFIKDWDSWREAGVIVRPLYLEANMVAGISGVGNAAVLQEKLLTAIFEDKGSLAGLVGGSPKDAAVLMSGIPGNVAAAISRELIGQGMQRERILFCEYL